MQFETNNKMWKSRSKHGRDYLFKTPEALWEAACEYFQWSDDNPVYKTIPRGPDYQPYVCIPKLRAYTLKGLYIYLGCGNRYFSHFEKQLAGKTDEVSEEFLNVISLIRDVIYEQKFTAAAAGELNPSLIARELNLTYNIETAGKDGDDGKDGNWIIWGDQRIRT
jgi:hypothetical protein